MTKEFLRSNFIAICLGAALVLLYPVIFIPKGTLELVINANQTDFLNVFFKYITHLGDGLLLALLLVSLLFVSYSWSIITAFSIAVQAILVSLFKRWIFKGLERPLAFFGDDVQLNLVEGVDVHSSNTFPSGHTASAFTLFALLCLVFHHRTLLISLFWVVLAFFVGLSRVYLMQHFLIDAYFGAIFGVISVVAGLYLTELIFSEAKLSYLRHRSLRDYFGNRNRS